MLVKKLFKKESGNKQAAALRALEESVGRIREELREAVSAHFADYKENLKFQYLFKLADAVSASLYESLVDRMRGFTGSLSDMTGLIENQRSARDETVNELASLEKPLAGLLDRIRQTEGLLRQDSSL